MELIGKQDPNIIPDTYCPFGTSSVLVPMMDPLRGQGMGIQTLTPMCTKKCMMYKATEPQGCTLLFAARKILA